MGYKASNEISMLEPLRSRAIAVVRRMYRSQLGRNIVSNYVGVTWLAFLSFATIPIYLHILGRTGWGLIAASLAIQMFLNFLDAGLSQVMPRWLAHGSDDLHEQAKLYRVFATIYFLVGVAGFLIGQLFASTLANAWFKTDDPAALELGLRIVLVQLLFQFANSANVGFWNGVQLQTLANVRQCLFTTLKHACSLVSMFFIARSPFSYLVSFAVVGVLEFFANRYTVVRRLSVAMKDAQPIGRQEFHAIVLQTGGFSVAVIIGTLVSQLDRIVLTGTQNTTAFGTYVIVANFALAFLQFQAPLTRAFFPRVVIDFKQQASDGSRTMKRLFFGIIVFSVAPCLLAAALSPYILHVWIHNDAIVAQGALPMRLLLVAVALNSIYNVIYMKILTVGASALLIGINIVCFVVELLGIYLIGTDIGIVLGGIIWLINSSTQLGLATLWLFLKRPDQSAALT